MRVQQSRTDVLPFTWEIPAAIACTWLFLALLALPVGQGAAMWLHGDGFAWPQGELVESILALLRGDPSATKSAAGDGPSAVLVYALIALAEVLVAVIAGFALVVWWRSTGPGTQHGLATRHQVAGVLGLGQLRRRRRVIRPDLHHPRHPGGKEREDVR